MKFAISFILAFITSVVIAQQTTPSQETSLVKNIPFTSIGPTIMSGRVVDLEVNPNNPNEFYAAYASGGLWHTKNNGTTFTPILDTANTQNIGSIAVHWKTRTIWVGTGENNSSRSSYAGIGILKSTDNGKTWTNVGLKDSHHIGSIVLNPNNPDEIVIGVIGHLYTPNKQRGVYKTLDGGKTWKQSLFISEDTGIIDVKVQPNNFNIQYAAAWQRERKAWNFSGNGLESGIYKSIDAGNTWIKINASSGFPTGKGIGRIGLTVYDSNTIYAVLDNQNRRKKDSTVTKKNLVKEDFKQMAVDEFLNLSDKKLNGFLKRNGFQEKYRAENVKQLVRTGEAKPNDIATYLETANSKLFDTPVIGAEVYRSDDSGKTWAKTHDNYIDDLFFSYGYYFGEIRVHPKNKDKIYLCGVPIIKSDDGGKTFTSINKENVHADHQALWVNPNLKGHLINGNDGGVNISYDDGESWIKCNNPAVGQFYTVNVDNAEPYNVYGGLQDNGVWFGPNNHIEDKSWYQTGKYPYQSLLGGDGMQIQVDNRDNNIVFTGYQFGNYYRIDKTTQKRKYIQPKHNLGEKPHRFNWQTPILLSPHNQDVLYLGGNKLMKSENQGDDWEVISDDLTQGEKQGNVAFGTITSISESTLKEGLIYTGSDDGLVYVTKNKGKKWRNIIGTLPKNLWVSRVIASSHLKSRVYVTLNGYRFDNFSPYIFISEDYGKTWNSISNTLHKAAINVIKEDLNDENILYIGTDNGLYISFNKGTSWESFSNGLPKVAVHDLVIQSQTNDLIVATHGRSLYKTNVGVFEEYHNYKNDALYVANISAIKHNPNWGSSWSKWLKAHEPSTQIQVFSANQAEATLRVLTTENSVLHEFTVVLEKGFNTLNYDLTITEKGKEILEDATELMLISKKKNDKYYLLKGEYIVEVNTNLAKSTVSLVIE
ncbi:MAG: glycosyl hydrolase [Flavobacteriaceae bacterium]|nr:glycosyl hydrolase [Flavobacteriaceae bacterium]